GAVDLLEHHPVKARHSVVDVHDELTRLELEAHRRQALAGAAAPGHGPPDPSEQLVVGEHGDAEPGVVRSDRQVPVAVEEAGWELRVEIEVELNELAAGSGLGEERLQPLG